METVASTRKRICGELEQYDRKHAENYQRIAEVTGDVNHTNFGELLNEDTLNTHNNYLKVIRERLSQERSNMNEINKRRRHIISTSLKEHALEEERQRKKQLEKSLLKQSLLEKRIIVQLDQTMQEKNVIIENRREREKEYEKRRKMELEAALDLEREIQLRKKVEEAGTLAILREAWANKQARRREAAHQAHLKFITEHVLEQLIQFSLKVVEFRDYYNKLVPAKLLRQWKTLFIAGHSLIPEDGKKDQEASISQTKNLEAPKNQLLNEAELKDYEEFRGEWDHDKVGVMECQHLPGEAIQSVSGAPVEWICTTEQPKQTVQSSVANDSMVFLYIVDRLRKIVCPTPPPMPPPDMPECPLRVVILGKPYSGKTTLANLLKQKLNFEVIDPESIMKELFKHAVPKSVTNQIDDTSSVSSGNVSELERLQMLCMTQLAEQLDNLLKSGRTVPDEILVNLVFHKMRTLPDGVNVILDGFPANLNQAKLLHQRLTVVQTYSQEPASQILGDSSKDNDAIDLVFLVDVDDDTIFQRAAKISVKGKDESSREEDCSATWSTSLEYRLERSHLVLLEMQQYYESHLKVLSPEFDCVTTGKTEDEINIEIMNQAISIIEEELQRKQLQKEDKTQYATEYTDIDELTAELQAIPDADIASDIRGEDSDVAVTTHSHPEFVELESNIKHPTRHNKSGLKPKITQSVKEKEPEEDGLLNEAIRSPCPGENDWIYVDEPISKNVATDLFNFYDQSEENFRKNVKSVLGEIRYKRWALLPRLYDTKVQFHNYLQRPDEKQQCVDQFKKSFNVIPEKMRTDLELKAELHCRTDQLRETLWTMLDKSKAESEVKMGELLHAFNWPNELIRLVANLYLTLMQLELGRFEDRVLFLKEYYSIMQGTPAESEPLIGTINLNAAVFTQLPLIRTADDTSSQSTSDDQSELLVSTERQDKPTAKKLPRQKNKPVKPVESQNQDTPSSNERFVESVVNSLNVVASLADIFATISKSGPGVSASKRVREPLSGRKAGGGKVTSRVSGLPQAQLLLLDKPRTFSQSESQFVQNVCLCALQVVQNHVEEEKQRRASEVKANSSEEKGKKRRGKSPNKGESKNKQMKKKAEKKTAPISEEQKARDLMCQKIHNEHLVALEELALVSKIRLTLIRVNACAVLVELERNLKETEQAMTEWIGKKTQKEYQAISDLVEFVRNTIEAERQLPELLVLDKDVFYIDTLPQLSYAEEMFEFVPEEEQPQDLGFFTMEDLYEMLQKFRQFAPTGYVDFDCFKTIVDLVMGRRLQQVSGRMSETSIHEILLILFRNYQSTFTETETVESEPVSITQAPSTYLNWRRFLLSASQVAVGHNEFKPPDLADIISISADLLEMAKYNQSTGADETILLDTRVTRTQFNLIPFPWYPEGIRYYNEMHNFIFSIFCELMSPPPTSSSSMARAASFKKSYSTCSQSRSEGSEDFAVQVMELSVQNHSSDLVQCPDLLIPLSQFGVDDPVTGFTRALSAIMVCELHINDPEETDVLTGKSADPLIPKAAILKILDAETIHRENEYENTENSAPSCGAYISPYEAFIDQIYHDLSGEKDDDRILWSTLAHHEPFIKFLKSASSRFQLATLPEPLPTILRIHQNPDTFSSSTEYDELEECGNFHRSKPLV